MRTAELVRMYAKEQILLWSDIHWKDGLIHVRPGVAKGTRRERGDERFVPLSDTAKEQLTKAPPTEKQTAISEAIAAIKAGAEAKAKGTVKHPDPPPNK
jgi:integrase